MKNNAGNFKKLLIIFPALFLFFLIPSFSFSQSANDSVPKYFEIAQKHYISGAPDSSLIFIRKIFSSNTNIADSVFLLYGKVMLSKSEFVRAKEAFQSLANKPDLHPDLRVSVNKLLEVTSGNICTNCNNTGWKDQEAACMSCGGKGKKEKECILCKETKHICSSCMGRGFVKQANGFGSQIFNCRNCNGSGIATCQNCKGTHKQFEDCKICEGKSVIKIKAACQH